MSLGNKETMVKNIKRLMALNQVNATATEAPTIGLLPNQIVGNLPFHFITFHNLLYANFPIIPENKKLFAFFKNLVIPRYICSLRSKCGQCHTDFPKEWIF